MQRIFAAAAAAAIVCLVRAQPTTLLIAEGPWDGPGSSLSRFSADPCASCVAAEQHQIELAAKTTGMGGKGSATCTTEVRALLCTAWCTPLRRRYVSAAGPCGGALGADTAVAVCPATCVALSGICRAPICGTVLAPFRLVRDEDAQACAGEPLISEGGAIRDAAFDISLSAAPVGDVRVTITGTGGARCDDTCATAADGTCDDGSAGGTRLCEVGTDTADCDSCASASNGVCDDGSLGGEMRCAAGTDTADCACGAVVPLQVVEHRAMEDANLQDADAAVAWIDSHFADAVSLTFGPGSWNIAQRVGMRASTDDAISWHGLVHQGQAPAFSVVHTDVTDAAYDQHGSLPKFGVLDNDLPGLPVSTGTALQTVEGVGHLEVEAVVDACAAITTDAACVGDCRWDGSSACALPASAQMAVLLSAISADVDGITDQYQVGPLATQPIGPAVMISITGPAAGGLAVFPSELEFNHSNWATAQTVGVQAVDNLVMDGTRQLSISHTVRANECVAADSTNATEVAICSAIVLSGDNAASKTACEVESTANWATCVYATDLSYMDYAGCLGDSLTLIVGIDDDDRPSVYTSVVSRPVEAAACLLGGAVTAAGTGAALPQCRAYDSVDRCCLAADTAAIDVDRLDRFAGVSQVCSQYIDYMLCGSACSAAQSTWAVHDTVNENSTITVCKSLCDHLETVCGGTTCADVLSSGSGGRFDAVQVMDAVTVFHPAEGSYREYTSSSHCFGGGIFMSENSAPVDMNVSTEAILPQNLISRDTSDRLLMFPGSFDKQARVSSAAQLGERREYFCC